MRRHHLQDVQCCRHEKVVTHETFHALTRTSQGDIEHGLVYAMTALELGGGDWQSYANDSFHEHPDAERERGYKPKPYHIYVHTFYKIFKKDGVGKDLAFQLVLGVDLRTPHDEAALQEAISETADDLGIGTQVAEVLQELNAEEEERITPTENDDEAKRKTEEQERRDWWRRYFEQQEERDSES